MKAANVLATIGNTPHIRINRLFGDANVWIKSERSNPGGSIKDRIASPKSRLMRMCGVLPMVARTLAAFMGACLLAVGWRDASRDNRMVKRARPPLGQAPKGGPGGRSGLHRAA